MVSIDFLVSDIVDAYARTSHVRTNLLGYPSGMPRGTCPHSLRPLQLIMTLDKFDRIFCHRGGPILELLKAGKGAEL